MLHMTGPEQAAKPGDVQELWDQEVTRDGENTLGDTVDQVRAAMNDAVARARENASSRVKGKYAATVGDRLTSIKERLADSRGKARGLLAGGPAGVVLEPAEDTEERAGELPMSDLHLLERLLSHVRHSIVRVCFYNLKLFAPSLVDEYDATVREQVLGNIEQLGLAKEEIDSFFGQALWDGNTIATHFGEARQHTLEQLEALIALAGKARGHLDEEASRAEFASKAPGLIDGVMDALQTIQKELDSRKLAAVDVVKEAAMLHKAVTEGAGLTVALEAKPCPKIFGDHRQLLNVFGELIANAAKYSQGKTLNIRLAPTSNKQSVEAVFEDDGQGMTEEELASCLERGVSKGGTGEGLAMVVELVEGRYLGEFEIDACRNGGCVATVRLPVKFNPRVRE